jgi:hypothetical protein
VHRPGGCIDAQPDCQRICHRGGAGGSPADSAPPLVPMVTGARVPEWRFDRPAPTSRRAHPIRCGTSDRQAQRIWSRQARSWTQRATPGSDADPSWRRRGTAGLGPPPSCDRNSLGGVDHQRGRQPDTPTGRLLHALSATRLGERARSKTPAGRMALPGSPTSRHAVVTWAPFRWLTSGELAVERRLEGTRDRQDADMQLIGQGTTPLASLS